MYVMYMNVLICSDIHLIMYSVFISMLNHPKTLTVFYHVTSFSSLQKHLVQLIFSLICMIITGLPSTIPYMYWRKFLLKCLYVHITNTVPHQFNSLSLSLSLSLQLERSLKVATGVKSLLRNTSTATLLVLSVRSVSDHIQISIEERY